MLLAAEQIVVPHPPAPSASEHAEDTGKGGKKGDDKGNGPSLPNVDPDDLGAGQRDRSRHPDPARQPDRPGRARSARWSTASPAAATAGDDPSVPVLSDLIDGVDRILQGVVDPLTGQTELPKP